MSIRITVAVAALSLLSVTPVSAQRARGADLRYAAPMPAKLSYLAIDSMQLLNKGLPIGDMQINASLRSLVDIDVTPTETGVRMKAMLKEFNGSMETPMGSMPFPGAPAAGTETEFNVMEKGLNLRQAFDDAKKSDISSMDMNSMMGRSREVVPLLRLPGRQTALNESWTDTVTVNDSIQGMHITMHMVLRGTYERDTVVNGRTLNVLVYRNDMKMTSKGVMQGRQLEQTMTSTSNELALWDSAEHLLISQHTTSNMNMEMTMPGMGFVTVSGQIKSVKQKTE